MRRGPDTVLVHEGKLLLLGYPQGRGASWLVLRDGVDSPLPIAEIEREVRIFHFIAWGSDEGYIALRFADLARVLEILGPIRTHRYDDVLRPPAGWAKWARSRPKESAAV